MDLLSDEFAPTVTDPLDAVEQAVIAEQYPYDRDETGEVHLTATGAWRDHQIWFAWRPELEAAFPAVPFTWIDLEQGGEGVFVVRDDELPR